MAKRRPGRLWGQGSAVRIDVIMKKPVAPRLSDSRFEPSARQLDAVARAAAKAAFARHATAMTAFYAAIRLQVAQAQATLARPPSAPVGRTRHGE